MDEYQELGAFDLAKKIRAKEISPKELVQSAIDHAEKVNPKINAIISKRYEEALSEADKAEKNLSDSDFLDRHPLYGVPCTVKETLAFEGHPHTMGTMARKGETATETATVVKRIRGAGAIPIATTNIPEWALWFECKNNVHGTTHNPYDLKRTPGGSSGGEAAIISSGASPFGLGSDIGGSIRMPAAFCGIFGHKPTNHLVPLTGHFPLYEETADQFSGLNYPYTVIGPLARKADDVRELFKLILGPDEIDPETYCTTLKTYEDWSWKGKKVYVAPDPKIRYGYRVQEDLRETVNKAGKFFEEQGAVVEELPQKFFHRALDIWTCSIKQGDGPNIDELFEREKRNMFKEIAKKAIGKSSHTFPVIFCLFGEFFESALRNKEHWLGKAKEADKEFEDLIDEDSILIFPPHSRVAPKHHSTYWRPFDFVYTAVFNSLKVPVTVAPMGLNKDGIPLAVQIVGRKDADFLTLKAAKDLEDAFGGWVPPKWI